MALAARSTSSPSDGRHSSPSTPARTLTSVDGGTLGQAGATDGPATPAPATRSAYEVLHAATAVGLPGGPTPVDVDDVDVEMLVGLATSEGLLGPLLAALPPDAQDLRERVLERHGSTMAWCLMLEQRLLDIDDWFAEAGGIRYLMLKGPSVAHLDEGDPSMRSFADLDLLIDAADIDRALTVLQDHGAQRRIPEHHRGFDRRFAKGVGLTCGDGIEIDTHRTLCVGALGTRIPLGDLFAHPDHFEVGGRSFAALSLPHRALHAAYHAVIGSSARQLRTLRDLAGYLGRLDPDTLTAEARRWRGETVLHTAVCQTFDALTFDAPAWRRWAASFEPDPRDVALIEASLHESTAPFDVPFLRELPWRDRPAYLWGVATPSKETLHSRGQTPWTRARDGVANLRRSR